MYLHHTPQTQLHENVKNTVFIAHALAPSLSRSHYTVVTRAAPRLASRPPRWRERGGRLEADTRRKNIN
ncbi:unnamed protein product, partial [Brenthis ino]